MTAVRDNVAEGKPAILHHFSLLGLQYYKIPVKISFFSLVRPFSLIWGKKFMHFRMHFFQSTVSMDKKLQFRSFFHSSC